MTAPSLGHSKKLSDLLKTNRGKKSGNSQITLYFSETLKFGSTTLTTTRMNIFFLSLIPVEIAERSVVIHEDMDDLGMGNHSDSLTTGHAGKRITCAVIGYSKRMYTKT